MFVFRPYEHLINNKTHPIVSKWALNTFTSELYLCRFNYAFILIKKKTILRSNYNNNNNIFYFLCDLNW